MSDELARDFLRDVESELKPLAKAVNLAHWEASTTGTADALESATAAETAIRKHLSSKPRYDRTVELLDSKELHDPALRRQLELLALDYRPNLLSEEVIDDLVRRSNRIQSEFYTFRSKLDGTEVTNNRILDILRSELDEERRRAAWEASKQIAPRVADQLLELVRLRNEAALSLGFSDFYTMHLELQEIDHQEILQVFDELKQQTDEPFRAAKADVDARLGHRFGIEPDGLYPWHYEDPFFQEPPLAEELGLGALFRGRDPVEVASQFYDSVGLPIRDVLARSDLYERPGKDQHAYCTDVDREGDVRILCNVKQDDRWMGVLLHELGHAAYDKFIPATLPWTLRQPAHIATTEAIAMFMDRLVYDIDWLEAALGSVPEREELGQRARDALRFEMLLTARWVLVMTYFERELYANPGRTDFNTLWWDLVEELQLLRRPEGRDEPDWAAKIHLAVAPVYYHNYLLGELIASQLTSTLHKEVLAGTAPRGYVGYRGLGAFLSDRVFASGARLHWQKLLEEATGSRLTPEPFIQEFVAV